MRKSIKKVYTISILLNIINFVILTFIFDNVSIGSLMLSMIVIPLIINSILIAKDYKKNKIKDEYHLLMPITTLLIYSIWAYIVSNNGMWTRFVEKISTDNMNIVDSPFSFSQITFSAIIYIAIGFLMTEIIYIIVNKAKK